MAADPSVIDSCLQIISYKAESVRSVYITSGSGKIMSYMEKVTEARAIRDNPILADALSAEEKAATYPILTGEMGITAETLSGVADVVWETYWQFKMLEAQINALEMGGKKAVREATDDEAARAAVASIPWPF
jgi:hypothetical protein